MAHRFARTIIALSVRPRSENNPLGVDPSLWIDGSDVSRNLSYAARRDRVAFNRTGSAFTPRMPNRSIQSSLSGETISKSG